jgi:prepilin-type N-terminal cleavage/methylation domain-containing protein
MISPPNYIVLYRTKNRQFANGFTLVELLVVISIMGFIGGMFAIAYRGAQQESNTQKTRSTIEKISRIVVSAYEDYTAEPLAIAYNQLWDDMTWMNWTFVNTNPAERARSRIQRVDRTALLYVRDRIRLEMPDHPDDIKWTRARTNAISGSGIDPDSIIRTVVGGCRGEISLVVNTALPTRAIRLMRKLSVIDNGSSYYRPIVDWEVTNANAELLFAIVEDATADGATALEAFGVSEIGDTDGDGLKEFIDAWGNPIGWIRWPSGSPEVLFSHPDPLDPRLVQNGRLALADEPYDKFASDPGWGTNFPSSPMGMPLVVSAGIDGVFGIRFALEPIPDPMRRSGAFFGGSRSSADCIWPAAMNASGSESWLPPGRNFCDPWYPRTAPQFRLASPLDLANPSATSDNVTNLQGTGVAL